MNNFQIMLQSLDVHLPSCTILTECFVGQSSSCLELDMFRVALSRVRADLYKRQEVSRNPFPV